MGIKKSDDLVLQFEQKGFHYSKDVLYNYYISLITKPFVILTGISGSGKSKIAELFAQIVSNTDEKNYELIPVKPNWRDSKGLFGFHNLIDDNYNITQLIQLFIRAINTPTSPFFLILDEMNIAQVEHYFADYLSLIESRRIEIDKNGLTFDSFNYNVHNSLSEALILAAFDVGKLNDYKEIATYRNNRFVQKWKSLYFNGNPDNWTPQVRTELNQKDSYGHPARLAGRMFEGGSGQYRLKDKSSLVSSDAKLYDELYKLYLNITSDHKTIKQENIILHNDTHCLSTGTGSKCSCATCPYKAHEKYKCSKLYDKKNNSYLVPPQIPIPLNVFTVGTVNVDETTYMFSPKILDRSNVIEFNEVDFAGVYKLSPAQIKQVNSVARSVIDNEFFFDQGKPFPELNITIPSVHSVNSFASKAPKQFDDLISIFTVLKKHNLHFGYRVMNEVSQYMINVFSYTDYTNGAAVAMDNQILQKILPKIYGSFDKIWSPLTEILGMLFKTPITINTLDVQEFLQILNSNSNGMIVSLELDAPTAISCFNYPKSAMKIMTMIKDLDDTGFATYIK